MIGNLIKINCIFSLHIFFSFKGDTLTSLFGVISFIFYRPILCKTVKYIDQSVNTSWRVLGFKK